MSDLDGEDAFRMLLDRMTESAIAERTATERASGAEQRARMAEAEQKRLANLLATATGEAKAALPKLSELWQAANAALGFMGISGRDDDASIVQVKDRLQKAIKDAGPSCDEIPF